MFQIENQMYCMKEQVPYLQKLKFQPCKLKRWYEMKFLTRTLWTLCVTQREM